MTTAGITDFTITDVSKPEAKRLRRNISAVINFAKFREERLTHYVEYTQETDALAAKKQQLQDENERLVTEVNTAEAHRAKEAPEEQRISAENTEREVVVRELWNKQTAVQKESQALKAKLHEVQDEVREANYKLLNAKEELERLSAQIVPDPKKLKQELAELQEAVAQEKAGVKAQEAKRRELSKQREALSRAEAKVDDLLQMQGEVRSEHAKLSGVRGTQKGITEEQARDEAQRSEQVHQIKALSQRHQHGRERMEKQRELHSAKAEDAMVAYSNAKQQWDELHSERARHTQQKDENEAVLRELRDKLLFAKIEHEADANRMQQQQQQLALQVRAYHENVFAATRAVSAQTATLVA